MIKHGKRGILTAAAVLLALSAVCLFLAQCSTQMGRRRREAQYLDCARRNAAEFHVPFPLVLAVIRTESDFYPDAVSPVGAMGLMQLMPETFAFLREEKLPADLPDSAVFDPEVNIRYGTFYLAYLHGRFGDWPTALAAYNAGEGRVTDWLEDPDLSENGVLKSIPFEETEQYVEKTLSYYEFYCEKYHTQTERSNQ